VDRLPPVAPGQYTVVARTSPGLILLSGALPDPHTITWSGPRKRSSAAALKSGSGHNTRYPVQPDHIRTRPVAGKRQTRYKNVSYPEVDCNFDCEMITVSVSDKVGLIDESSDLDRQ